MTITHVFEVFKIQDLVLKDTPVVERPGLVLLVEPLDTTCEQLVDDLIIGVKHVVLGD
jgi:hypothetical protein